MGFRVGQKVVCIKRGQWADSVFNRPHNGDAPKFGIEYTVRGYSTLCPGCIYLEEICLPETNCHEGWMEPAWLETRFRAVIKQSTETGMAILKKVANDASKKRVREDAL